MVQPDLCVICNTKTNFILCKTGQPDLCVICNLEQLDAQGCNGAPDWIIEILSKGNSKHETQDKYTPYQESGVKEYWIVYPYEQSVHQFVLNEQTENTTSWQCSQERIQPVQCCR